MIQAHLFEVSRKTEAISIVSSCDGYRKDFLQYIKDNWHIYLAFERRAFRLISRGYSHGSAYEIVENIRWQSRLAERESEFKINNNYRPDLARLFEDMNEKHRGFFRNRVRKAA